ncbi:hypothetical protein K9N68_04555 [Kovacikia minuta CCNUW1]|uniref:hypothetical protein n=1 Tax=Kovacikia minuta TaxID=2931930 RepID=UPI001CCF791F|nr:hypothetical protein [Kovacikia minuta]UBF27241.1 hypothetical protein K9N68_04555 [Kovacikia minuta CCNUW1]
MTTQQLEDRTQQLEDRIAVLEAELAQIKQLLLTSKRTQHPWWETVFGSFANCPAFDEMERLGREWRTSYKDEFEEQS